jgi:hypothetical protein
VNFFLAFIAQQELCQIAINALNQRLIAVTTFQDLLSVKKVDTANQGTPPEIPAGTSWSTRSGNIICQWLRFARDRRSGAINFELDECNAEGAVGCIRAAERRFNGYDEQVWSG